MRFFLSFLSFFLFPSFAFAAVNYSDISSGGQSSGATLTVSHVVATDEILAVGVGSAQEGTDIITGCTFNGDAMTKADDMDGGDATYASVWYLETPDVGTYNVVCTTSFSGRGTMLVAVSFSGSSGFGASDATGVSPAGSSISTSLTTTGANSVLFAFATRNGSTDDLTPVGSGQVQIATVVGESRGYASTATTTTVGSYSSTWNTSSSQVMKQVVLEVLEGSGPSPDPGPTASTTTDITRADWLFVNSILVFLLSLIPMGLIFSLFIKKRK